LRYADSSLTPRHGRRVVVSLALEMLNSEERRFSPLLEPRVPFGVAVWRKDDTLARLLQAPDSTPEPPAAEACRDVIDAIAKRTHVAENYI